MIVPLAIVGVTVITVTLALLVDRKREQVAKRNGNGFEQLEQVTKRCTCDRI